LYQQRLRNPVNLQEFGPLPFDFLKNPVFLIKFDCSIKAQLSWMSMEASWMWCDYELLFWQFCGLYIIITHFPLFLSMHRRRHLTRSTFSYTEQISSHSLILWETFFSSLGWCFFMVLTQVWMHWE